jgi:HD-like signal output (HDOD) protein
MASLSDGLPTLPAYVFELNTLLSTTPVDMRRVVEVIRTDPSLAAQVIRLSNSALLGLREQVSSIEHAVVLLGTERLRTLVLTCSLLEYVGQKLNSKDVQTFWQHCFLTATLSERLARGTGYPQPEQAYLAGLLHDVGTLPLLVICNSWKGPLDNPSLEGWGESVKLERERFGTDHCEIGRWIGISWNFSPTLLEVFEHHHSPHKATNDPHLLGLVAAADQFCVRRGFMMGGEPPELDKTTPEQNDELLRCCLPQLTAEDARRLREMMETDFLHLVQLIEFGAAGLFGGGIPMNPFR